MSCGRRKHVDPQAYDAEAQRIAAAQPSADEPSLLSWQRRAGDALPRLPRCFLERRPREYKNDPNDWIAATGCAYCDFMGETWARFKAE
jgi:hypothetical protein